MPKVRIYVDGFTDVGAITPGNTDYSVYIQLVKASEAEKVPEVELPENMSAD